MRQTWIRITWLGLLILLPVVLHWLYLSFTGLPDQIAIAIGPGEGQYQQVANALADEIEAKLQIPIRRISTEGSPENLRKILSGEVQFALCQSGTHRLPAEHDPSAGHGRRPEFVANLYSEVSHVLVRRDAGIDESLDLRGKRVAVGTKNSGNFQLSLILLRHLGLEDAVEMHHFDYGQMKGALRTGRIHAALITTGRQAPLLQELLPTGDYKILELACAESLADKNISIAKYEIPRGFYRVKPESIPESKIATVAVRAQLVTGSDVSSRLVEAVTQLVLRKEFLRKNQLIELHDQGKAFAQAQPEFEIHPGAQHSYNPSLRPPLDPNFIDATEGLRSFIASTLIAGYLLFRWLRERRIKAKEHRLDRYIRSLLDIEQRQVALDANGNSQDVEALQKLLDDVTNLRQQALREFTAHELSEDRAVDCFLEMSHALSDKINAKLTRQRLDRQFDELTAALQASENAASTTAALRPDTG